MAVEPRSEMGVASLRDALVRRNASARLGAAMYFHRAIAAALFAVLVVGLASAYLAAAAGVLGLINARMVSFVAICGASVAFIAGVFYFAGWELRLRRRAAR